MVVFARACGLERYSAKLNRLRCASGEAIGQARHEERCQSASVERRNAAGAREARNPPTRNPKGGRGLLRGGIVLEARL